MKKQILAFLFVALFGSGFVATAAEPVGQKPQAKDAATLGETIQLQPDVKVTLTGKNRGTLRKGAISGEFDCYCDPGGTGSCDLNQSGYHLSCTKSENGPCTSNCRLSTTIKGGAKTKIVK